MSSSSSLAKIILLGSAKGNRRITMPTKLEQLLIGPANELVIRVLQHNSHNGFAPKNAIKECFNLHKVRN